MLRFCSGGDQFRDLHAPQKALFAPHSTLTVLFKPPLGGCGVAVGLPASAAGVVPAAVADKAYHILQRIPQKYADLMGKFLLQTETVRKLFQQHLTIRL